MLMHNNVLNTVTGKRVNRGAGLGLEKTNGLYFLW